MDASRLDSAEFGLDGSICVRHILYLFGLDLEFFKIIAILFCF